MPNEECGERLRLGQILLAAAGAMLNAKRNFDEAKAKKPHDLESVANLSAVLNAARRVAREAHRELHRHLREHQCKG